MRVPVYDQPQVAQAALPEVRSHLDVSNGLGAVGEGISRLGAGVQRALDEHQQAIRIAAEKATAGASADAENGMANDALTRLYGSPDGSVKGYFQLQGKDALAGSAQVQQDLQQLQQQYAAKLSPQAKALFLPRSSASLLQWRRQVEEYAGRQNDAANLAAAHSLGDTAERVASTTPGDDSAVATASAAAETALAAQLHGMPPEMVKDELGKLRQRVAVARVQAAVQAGDVDMAQRLLYGEHADAPQPTGDAAADALAAKAHALAQQANPDRPGLADQLGVARPALEKTVATLRAQQAGQKSAQNLIDFATDQQSGLIDQGRLQEAFNATPPEARTKEFLQAFEAKKSAALQLDAGQKSAQFSSALTAYLRGGNNLNAVPAETKQWLVSYDPQGWQRLVDTDRSWRAGRGTGGAEGNPAQLAALNQLRYEMAKEPEKFVAMTPAELAREWAPQLSPSGFREAGELHAKLIAASQKPDRDIKLPGLVYSSVINSAAHAFGETNSKTNKPLAPAAWSAEHHQLFDQVVNSVIEQDRAYRKAHGGNGAPPDQLEKWAQQQLVVGKVKDSGFLGMFGRKETAVEAQAKGDVLVDENGKPISTDGATPPAASAANLNLDTTPTKAVVSYRYNKSRSMRIPIYEDGAQGAPEAAPRE